MPTRTLCGIKSGPDTDELKAAYWDRRFPVSDFVLADNQVLHVILAGMEKQFDRTALTHRMWGQVVNDEKHEVLTDSYVEIFYNPHVREGHCTRGEWPEGIQRP